jgi:hypothetical protein
MLLDLCVCSRGEHVLGMGLQVIAQVFAPEVQS